MAVTIGQMRHRVTIQQTSSGVDGMGGETERWVDGATVWAKVQPLSGSELFRAQQIESTVSHKITIRYGAVIDPTKRIRHGSKLFEIHTVIDVDETHKYIELLCSETVEIV